MSYPSLFAQRLASGSGIVDLMADLGEALNVNPSMLFLGGGNPARIPEFEALMAQELKQLAGDEEAVHRLLGVYQSPQGSEALISELSAFFQGLAWPVTEQNICLSSGSQSAFFMLFNLLAGPEAHAEGKKILLPMLPEYLGYAQQGLAEHMFEACAPLIEEQPGQRFSYHCDFEAVESRLAVGDIAALCVSRPTNPSGNVHSVQTMECLGRLADKYQIPLIVDAAYGDPFPGVVYDAEPIAWKPNRIFVLSLSKLGLPGVRTGIVVADTSLIEKLSAINTVLSLANGNLGPALFESLLKAKKLKPLCSDLIQPFYERKRNYMQALIDTHLQSLPYRLHQAQGAFFLWLWLKDLPLTSFELYERLKKRSLLVMDGSHFFFGSQVLGSHQHECLRLSYCAEDAVLEQAVILLADELKQLYAV